MVLSAQALLVQEFPTFSTNAKMMPLDSGRLGATLGAMWTVYHSEIFLSVDIKSFHKHYALEEPNAVYITQPRLTFDRKWYVGKKSAEFKPILKGQFNYRERFST
jgi:hypothetical protein